MNRRLPTRAAAVAGSAFRWRVPIVAALIVLLAGAPAARAQTGVSGGVESDSRFNETILEDSFAAFKQDTLDTRCNVPRLGNVPFFGEKVSGYGPPLSAAEVDSAYACVKAFMLEAYGGSAHPAALDYPNWRLFSTAPYRSRAHARRYVSNYANRIAAARYGRFEQVGEMPVGSMLAKDSFSVTASGRVVIGALALMEKMPPGFSPDTGDWRFTLVLPDGRVLGATGDRNAVAVGFCADCHRDAGPAQDYLFFMPLRNRPGQP